MRTKLLGALATIAGAFLVGCSDGPSASSVSVVNLTQSVLIVRATLDVPPDSVVGLEPAPVTMRERRLAPNTSDAFALDNPPGVNGAAVEFVVRVEGEGGVSPYQFRMAPPGPFLLKIMGPAEQLRLERERVSPSRDRGGLEGVPSDPRRRAGGRFPT